MKDSNKVCDILTSKEGFYVIRIYLDHGRNDEPIYLLLDTGTSTSLMSLDKIRRESNLISFRFYHEGKKYIHYFKDVKEDRIQMIKDFHIQGIIGVDFLLKNQLKVDFGRSKISSGFSNRTIQKYDFVYPLRIKNKALRVPIVGIKTETETFAFLIDSGSNYNIISSDLVNINKSSSYNNTEPVVIENMDNSINGYTGNVVIKVASLNKSNIRYIPYSVSAAITDTSNFAHDLFKGNLLKGVLGSRFLSENRWIMDFKNMVVYSLA